MSLSNSSNTFSPNKTQILSLSPHSLTLLTHKPSASQIPIFIIVHSVSQSFHLLHHFSFLSFLTSFSLTLAPLRNRISTTSPFPLKAAQCNGVWKNTKSKIYLCAISCECEHTICHKIVSHCALFISQYGNPLPLPIHIFSLFLSFFLFCMNLMDTVTFLHSPIQ